MHLWKEHLEDDLNADMKKVAILQFWLVEIISDCGKFVVKIPHFLCAKFVSTSIKMWKHTKSILRFVPLTFKYYKHVLLHLSWLYL